MFGNTNLSSRFIFHYCQVSMLVIYHYSLDDYQASSSWNNHLSFPGEHLTITVAMGIPWDRFLEKWIREPTDICCRIFKVSRSGSILIIYVLGESKISNTRPTVHSVQQPFVLQCTTKLIVYPKPLYMVWRIAR